MQDSGQAADRPPSGGKAASGPDRPTVGRAIITAITPTPRHPGRVEVWVEGTSFLTLSLDAIERLRLAVGGSVAGREVVERAARKKLRALAPLDPAVRRRRLYAFLARRGYDGEDIRRAMDAVGEELRGGEDVEE